MDFGRYNLRISARAYSQFYEYFKKDNGEQCTSGEATGIAGPPPPL
jgi:hypothetical protein